MTVLQYLTSKLLERCPLKYQIVRVLNAYDPRYFIQHQDSAIEKFELILKKFLEKKGLTATKCDTLLQQYRNWLKEEGDTDANACQSFDPKRRGLTHSCMKKWAPVILLLAVPRRLFCFGSLVVLDVVFRYLSLC